MTLIELLVSVGFATLIFVVVGRMSLFGARSYTALANYNDLDQASQNALDTMSREIRQTVALLEFVTNGVQRLTFKDYDGNQLKYEWNPSTRNLVRKKVGKPDKILLKECDNLFFHISQQNPSNNFVFYQASGISTAKLIDINWTCSRKIVGAKVNTESVQTAKIVMRNRESK
jgi:hypothetical protein